jgi:hypothetical protein
LLVFRTGLSLFREDGIGKSRLTAELLAEDELLIA